MTEHSSNLTRTVYLIEIIGLLIFWLYLMLRFFSNSLRSQELTPILDPWFVLAIATVVFLVVTGHVLLHFGEIESFRLAFKWNLATVAATGLVILSPVIPPSQEITAIATVLFLNCQFSHFKFALVANFAIGLFASVQRMLVAQEINLSLFWVLFFVLHVTMYLMTTLRDRSAGQERDLIQARWAATKFANLNIDIQNKVHRKEQSVMMSERSRIAHEIHDTVGHALTSALYQVRSLKQNVVTNGRRDPELFQETEQVIAQALSDMRREVYSLGDSHSVIFSWPLRWRKLCMVFEECTGVTVLLRLPDDLETVDDRVGENLFRIIQESLTNAIRHGRATLIDVTFAYQKEDRRLLLRISDNGIGSTKVTVGLGISGIVKRARQIGGEVAWETELNRGFDLGVDVRL